MFPKNPCATSLSPRAEISDSDKAKTRTTDRGRLYEEPPLSNGIIP